MRKWWLHIMCLLLTLPVAAQDPNTPGSAGTDFYFAVFDHLITPANSQQNVTLQVISAANNNSMTIRIDGKPSGTWTDFGVLLTQLHPKPLQVVHLTTTQPTYISALVKGETDAAETMLLPTHLLGTSYMLQGVPGALIDVKGTPTSTYSQFSVIGTANNTTVTIQTPVDLICVSTNQTVSAGTKAQFQLSDEQALLFQPTDYTQSISGVQVRTDHPVAVFQGNDLTRIYPGENNPDYTWEQARPTTTFGTEFIVPKSALFTFNIAQVTAQYDNTDIYCWVNGTKMFMKTLNAGESYARVFDTGSSGKLDALHLQTTKPACCYLYLPGSARNNDKGDPAMVEIAPIDNPSTDTRWVLSNPAENNPYTYRTLVTCRKDNADNILLNNVPLTGSNMVGTVTDDYITYEMPLSALQTMRLHALQGGFSAYNIRVGKTAEASAFSLSMPEMYMPPVTILAPDTVCIDTKNTFSAEFENGESVTFPLEYQWYFSADSLTWTPLNEGNGRELKLKAKPRHTGWYKVVVSSVGSSDSPKCRAESEPHHFYVIEDCPPILCPDGILLFREDFGGNEPSDPRVGQTPVPGMTYQQLLDDQFGVMRSGRYLLTKSGYCNGDTTQANLPQNRRSQWHLQDDHTYPGDKTRGYLLEVDGKGDNAAFYTTTIDGLCAGSDLSFVAYVANVMTWVQYVSSPGRYASPRLLFRLTDPATNAELAAYDTGEIPFDSTFIDDYACWQQSSQWHQVGMNFTVPEGVSSVKLTIFNNSQGAIGNDFALDDIEVRLCMEPISVAASNPACRKKPLTLRAEYENYGTLETPEFRWSYSSDSLSWTTLQTDLTPNYTIPVVHKSHEGWYRVTVANAGNSDSPNCREESEPFKLETMYCNTATNRYIDTTACDTLLEYDLHWRGHAWPAVGTVIDTLRDIDIDDSLYIHLTLKTQICCPDIQTFRIDSAVCDTLLPFLWLFRDTMVLFTDIGEQELAFTHTRWENCIGEIFTFSLDTFHCERLYPIIVNKYNWQLLLDNVALRRFFPERQYLAYQWYKNGEPIAGATEDDYSETNELNGFFQLCIKLDEPVDNHDEYIWSNVLEIGEVENPHPVQVRIYDSHGFLMPNENLPCGIYLYRYEQGNRVWTEKRFIP